MWFFVSQESKNIGPLNYGRFLYLENHGTLGTGE